jgi:MFS family permease
MAGDRFPRETGTVFGAIIAVGLVGGIAGPMLGSWAAMFNPARVLVVPLVAAIGVAALTWIVSRLKFAVAANSPITAPNTSGTPCDVP